MVENIVDLVKGVWRAMDKPTQGSYVHYGTHVMLCASDIKSISSQVKHEGPITIFYTNKQDYRSTIISVGDVRVPSMPGRIDVGGLEAGICGIDFENEDICFNFDPIRVLYEIRLKNSCNSRKEQTYLRRIAEWRKDTLLPFVNKYRIGEIYIANNGDIVDAIEVEPEPKYWLSDDKRIRVPTCAEAKAFVKSTKS
jgi:hypothetical protein